MNNHCCSAVVLSLVRLALLVSMCCAVHVGSTNSKTKFMSVTVTPNLKDDCHTTYHINVKCTADESIVVPKPLPTVFRFDVTLTNDADKRVCPTGYQIGIAMMRQIGKPMMHKQHDKENQDWSNWSKPHISMSPKLQTGDDVIYHKIALANHFKMVISPNLAPTQNSLAAPNPNAPKMVYRVDIACANDSGGGALEFSTFTQHETLVVLNAVGTPKCVTTNAGDSPQYKIRVWPTLAKWMQKENLFDEPEFVREAVIVQNDTKHEIKFANNFNLQILPPLDQIDGFVYYVEVKCHGARKADTFRSYTKKNAQIVLNVANCTAYDIFVTKLDTELVQDGKNQSEEIKNAVAAQRPNKIKNAVAAQRPNKDMEVHIAYGETYTFAYDDEQLSSPDMDMNMNMNMDMDMDIMETAENGTEQDEHTSASCPLAETVKSLQTDVEEIKKELMGMKHAIANLDTTMNELREYLEYKFNGQTDK